MDHDVMHKDVASLKNFRMRVEKVIPFVEGLMASGGKLPPSDLPAQLSDEDRAKVVSQVVAALGERLDHLEERQTQVEAPKGGPDISAVEERVAALEAKSNAPAPATDPAPTELSVRLEDMLTWFDANREGLEVLLGLDGDPDQSDGASAGAGTGAGDAGSATGAGSATAGTTDTTAEGAAPAPAPAGDQPQEGTSTEPAPAPATTDPAAPAG